ncbi:phage integrase SAM-like domain-containing protein [Chondrinema litorale]|uniref:phage integrase SAM-like domain-containing protein n=1 Tax=Chondrinema litorale TaxID=2994555 RepID=UPI002542D953|nr:phage integrase SAM-like domain-containing protein [Chondrinema litorale]UZR95337.1 phage integrase SAM-like domain-containing protein [Chondrinema litorale]
MGGKINHITKPKFNEKKRTFDVQFFPKNTRRKNYQTIYCHISVNQKRTKTAFSTSVHIPIGLWDKNAKYIMSREYDGEQMKLNEIKSNLEEIYSYLKTAKRTYNAEIIKRFFLEKDQVDKSIIELYYLWLEDMEAEIDKSITMHTWKKYHNKLSHLKQYLTKYNLLNISVEDINEKFGVNFEVFLERELNLKHNTAMRSIMQLNRVLTWGVRKDILEKNKLSFYEYNFQPPEAPKFLSAEQLEKFTKFSFNSPSLQRVSDSFIFQCWTSFDYADLVDFRNNKHIITIDNKLWIRKRRSKARLKSVKQIILVPIFPEVKKILVKYDWKVPIFSEERDKVMSYDKYRKYLKECAEILGIDENLVTKTGRKTFINMMYECGLDSDDISAMVGHNSPKTTIKFYLQFSSKRIRVSVEKVFGKDFMVG